MAAYAYTAINAQGLELSGEVHAPDPKGAREQLRLRGLLAQSLAEMPAFFSLPREEDGSRHGILVEYDATAKIYTQPSDERTEGYVTGRFG